MPPNRAAKVFLETIRVARHVGGIVKRPIEKAALQALTSVEEVATWTLNLQPVEDVLGKQRRQQVIDSYAQAKNIAGESLASLSHQSLMSGLQSGAGAATSTLQNAGLDVRVIGPFDEHWSIHKVVKDLRTEVDKAADARDNDQLNITPRRFVQFMRKAQRTKRRSLQRDPIEAYVERLLSSGSHLSRTGPTLLEKRIYMDMAGIICFSFDQALLRADGTQLWGHELHIKRRKAKENDMLDALLSSATSHVGLPQVEAIVDHMLRSEDFRVIVFMQGIQRQLLVNCCVMVLQLLEYLTSDPRMQVTFMGHALRFRLEPLPLEHVLAQVAAQEETTPRFHVNSRALSELVEALLDEEETQDVFVPDILEAEVYRQVLHSMICCTQAILKELRIKLFGIEVRLNILLDEDDAGGQPAGSQSAAVEVDVLPKQLQACSDRLAFEKRRILAELQRRQDERQEAQGTAIAPGARRQEAEGEAADVAASTTQEQKPAEHEFHTLAAQDRLARSLAIHHHVDVPIEMAFKMVSNFDEYPAWMPFCTSGRTLERGEEVQTCEVGFGIETGTMLGTVGDNIRYNVRVRQPAPATPSKQPDGGQATSLRTARVVADTVDGFAYGKRLVYDWRFAETATGQTSVQLDIFFQAKNVFSLPLWDSLQTMITSVMMKKFMERASELGNNPGSNASKHLSRTNIDTGSSSASTGSPRAAGATGAPAASGPAAAAATSSASCDGDSGPARKSTP